MLAAETTSGLRVRSLDAMRGIAAVLVILNHVLGIPGGGAPGEVASLLSMVTDAGLWLFFVVSGYLISRPFLTALVDGTPAPRMRMYAVRRFLRILPAYWAALVLTLGTLGTSSKLLQSQGIADAHLGLSDWVSSFILLQEWTGAVTAFQAYNVIWSLPVEIVFYGVVPVLFVAAGRWARGGTVPLRRVAAGVVGLEVVGLLSQALETFPLTHARGVQVPVFFVLFHLSFLSSFAPGMLIALARTDAGRQRWRRAHELLSQPRWRDLWPAAATTLFLAGFATWEFGERGLMPLSLWRAPLFGLAAAVLLWVALDGRGRTWHACLRVMAPVGTISYGLFLFHWVVLRTLYDNGAYPVTWLPPWASLFGKIALALVLAVPLGALSWYLIERPAMRWSARIGRVPPRPGRRAVVASLLLLTAATLSRVVPVSAAAPPSPSPPALWHRVDRIPGLRGITDARTGHDLVAAAAGELLLVDAKGGTYPFSRGPGGFRYDPNGNPSIVIPLGVAPASPRCRFRQDDAYAAAVERQQMVIFRIDDRGVGREFASSGAMTHVIGIAFDTTGRFGGDMLVVGTSGNRGVVVEVDCAGGTLVLVSDLPTPWGAPAVAAPGFGQFAGDLFVAIRGEGLIAVTPAGTSVHVDAPPGMPWLSQVPAGLSGGDYAFLPDGGSIDRTTAADLRMTGVAPGDLLMAGGNPVVTSVLRCTETCQSRVLGTGREEARGKITFLSQPTGPAGALPRDPVPLGWGLPLLLACGAAITLLPALRWRRH